MHMLKKITYKKTKKVFLKWFLTYFTLILAIFIMFTVVYYKFVLDNIKKETEVLHTQQVEYAIQSVNSELRKFDFYAHRIMSDGMFSENNIGMSAYNSYECVEELKKYKSANDFAADVGVYYLDSDQKLYCESGVYDIDLYFNGMYKFQNYNEELFRADLDKIKTPVLLPFDKAKCKNGTETLKLSIYIYPIKNALNDTAGCVFFLIDEDTFSNLFREINDDGYSRFAVWDRDGKLIYERTDNLIKEDSVPSIDILQYETGITHKRIDKKSISVSYLVSGYNGWRYSLWAKDGDFFNRMIYMRNIFLTLELLLFVLSLALLFYLIYINYQPLKRLTQISPGDDNENEFERIINVIIGLKNENGKLERMLNRGREVEKQMMLCRLLLSGEYDKAFINKLDEIGIEFNYEYNVVYVFSLNGYDVDERILFAFINAAEEYAQEYGNGYGTKLLSNNVVALILNTDCSDIEKIGQTAEKLKQLFKKEFNIDVVCGMSGCFKSNSGFNTAYNLAKEALLRNLKTDRGSVMTYDELKNLTDKDYMALINSEKQLLQAIINGDSESVNEIIDSVLKPFYNNSISVHQVKMLYSGMFHSIVKLLYTYNLECHIPKIVEFFITMDSVGIVEFSQKIKAYLGELCMEFERKKNFRNEELVNKIMEYVDEHCFENTLSLKEMENVFKSNGSYLSRVLKKHTGMPLMKYIDKIRMEKIKQLLCETDYTLNVIAEKVGFVDSNGLIRKFKKTEGITPNQYRMMIVKGLGGKEKNEQKES